MFILTPTPWNKYHYWIHFTGEKAKVLSSYVTCQGHLGHWNFTCTFRPRKELKSQLKSESPFPGRIPFYLVRSTLCFHGSVIWSCLTLCDPMDCCMLGFLSFTVSWSLLKLMSIELVMPSNHLILCHPLLLLPSTFPSIRVFANELALHIRWPKSSQAFNWLDKTHPY